MIPNQGLSDYDRLQRGSPSPMASFDMMQDIGGKPLGGWTGNGWNTPQEVSICVTRHDMLNFPHFCLLSVS